jgi:hypothetical protein
VFSREWGQIGQWNTIVRFLVAINKLPPPPIINNVSVHQIDAPIFTSQYPSKFDPEEGLK